MAEIAHWKASVSVAAFVVAFAGSGMIAQASDKALIAEAIASAPAAAVKQPPAKLESIAMKRAATKASGGTIYEIGAGDKLRIKFFQRDELSGEFRVRADGNISLPLIGSLAVRGRTPVELEQLISSKFFEMTSRSAFAVVDVIERRPFFVAGDVSRPGTFQYVPRMTVVHAVAIAGGIYRMPQAANQMMDVTREQWRLRSAKADAAVHLAKRERLRAQLNGEEEVHFPKMLVELVGAAQASRIERTQRRLFNQALSWSRGQEAFHKEALSLADEELKELRERLATMTETLKVHGADLKTTERLFQRGLTQRRNVYQKKYAISNLETTAASVRAEIKRAELKRMQAAKRLAELGPNESRKIALELDGVESEFESSMRNIAASKNVIGQAVAPNSGLQTANFSSLTRKYTILRSVKGKMTEIDASEHDRLLPGDVLKVSLQSSDSLNGATNKVIEARSNAPKLDLGGQQTAKLVGHLTDLKELLLAQSAKLAAFEKNQRKLAREVNDWRIRYREAVKEGVTKALSDRPAPLKKSAETTAAPSLIKSSTKIDGRTVPLPVKRPFEKVAMKVQAPVRSRPAHRIGSAKLVVSLQSELKRVGCYSGQVDGMWGPLSKGAMVKFGHSTRTSNIGAMPSMRAFLLVKRWRSGICKSKQVAQVSRR